MNYRRYASFWFLPGCYSLRILHHVVMFIPRPRDDERRFRYFNTKQA